MLEHGKSSPSIGETRALLQRVFAVPRFADDGFLSWLYEANPAGEAVRIDHGDTGHLAMVPGDYRYNGKPVKIGLALHTAVDARARGQGLFGKMALALIERARAEGYSHIIGVANGNATHGWLSRAGFRLVGALPVKMGVYLGLRKAGVREISAADIAPSRTTPRDNSQDWSRTLGWRLSMPGGHYRIFDSGDAIFILHVERKAGVKIAVILKVLADAPLSRRRMRQALSAIGLHLGTPFFLHAGYNNRFAFSGFDLPRALLPSPLNLIVKALGPQGDMPAFRLDCFEFLDFDAY